VVYISKTQISSLKNIPFIRVGLICTYLNLMKKIVYCLFGLFLSTAIFGQNTIALWNYNTITGANTMLQQLGFRMSFLLGTNAGLIQQQILFAFNILWMAQLGQILR